jgi:hypothetical protein
MEIISLGNVYVRRLRKALWEANISYVLFVRVPIRNQQLGFQWMELVKVYIQMFTEICINIFG